MIKVLSAIFKLVFVGLFLFSVILNISMFVGGGLYSTASSVFDAATGTRSLATRHADEVAELSSDLAHERVAKRKLRAEIAEASAEVSMQKATTRRLRTAMAKATAAATIQQSALRRLKSELDDPASRRIAFRGKQVAAREAVEATTSRVSRRAVKSTSREVSAMFGEVIPYAGVAVIVGATALELKDLCDTMKDMAELRRAFSPDVSPLEDEATVCSQRIPSRDELWATVKASPQAAWSASVDAIPSWEDFQKLEFPDASISGAWGATIEGAGGAWGYTKGAVSSATGSTKKAARGTWEWITNSDEVLEEKP